MDRLGATLDPKALRCCCCDYVCDSGCMYVQFRVTVMWVRDITKDTMQFLRLGLC
jgi:hypothetical protein